MNQTPHYVYPLPPLVDQLNSSQASGYDLDELILASQRFQELQLGSYYEKIENSDSPRGASRFQISPRGVTVANALLDAKQRPIFDRISSWRWWMPIAGLASVTAVALTLFELVNNA
ncbi:hypothetical protein GCM10023115_18280 [Pontixanthobacter gangjinensis]|uniref:Uncharacterized protein n=1 Tax=Pontixanthobacter gangjinensis TaxID=1028742 RepID=A0A6I4SPT0_9SPHN|nr:hypothetical protein [Pontixanthobacter gangjinensis]MXO57076.1 hypothetical protein [Pontixanthobacter gangjinensis]